MQDARPQLDMISAQRSYEQVVRKFSRKRKVRIVRPKVRDRRKQESKSEVFTGKGESMTLLLLAKVRFLRRETEVSTLWTEELTA
jgi:hypothetical protein